jgi:hypothetical protein
MSGRTLRTIVRATDSTTLRKWIGALVKDDLGLPAALALPAPAFARGPRSNPHKPFKFHEHPRMSFRNRETGEAPTLAEWAEMVARAHQIIDDYRYRSPEQLEWAAKVDPAYYADVVVLAAYNAPSKKNPDPARAQILKPLFGAGRKLVRAVNRGAGPDVEGALLARARAAAQEADARGLPGSRILRAMLKEMQSRQVGIWRNPVAVPVGQGLIINSSKRR